MAQLDVRSPEQPWLVAVLLHPHPRFGGNRFHPFVDGLANQLPELGVAAVRFDFVSDDGDGARRQVEGAIEASADRWPGAASVLMGYSFGAGVAASVADPRLKGWYLLAPQVEPLRHSRLGEDARPKRVVVPELDQYGPPAAVQPVLETWIATTVSVAPGIDHFLGPVGPVVDDALQWVRSLQADG